MDELMVVHVVYADPQAEMHAEVRLAAGSTIADAIAASGLSGTADMSALATGIWGKLETASTPLRNGDRVEIYRPLKADPNTARQHRVAKRRATGCK